MLCTHSWRAASCSSRFRPPAAVLLHLHHPRLVLSLPQPYTNTTCGLRTSPLAEHNSGHSTPTNSPHSLDGDQGLEVCAAMSHSDTPHAVNVGCFGRASIARLPVPPQEPKETQHARRRSLGSWFSYRSSEGPPAEGGERTADADALAEILAGLELENASEPAQQQQQRKAADKAASGKLSSAPVHRRRWSLGRQVAPQPQPEEAEDAARGSTAAETALDDDLLARTSSDLSYSSRRSSPTHASRQGAALPPPPGLSQQQQQPESPGDGAAAAAVFTPPRGQGGYRRLWHSITSVRKGDPLPAANGGPGGDVTVESLVRGVQARRSWRGWLCGLWLSSWGACMCGRTLWVLDMML